MAVIFNDKVVSGSVNGATISYKKSVSHQYAYAYQVKWSGTGISGKITVQASLNNEDWVTIEDGEEVFTADNGCILFDNHSAVHNFTRLLCESVSGDIMFEAWMLIKRPKKTE